MIAAVRFKNFKALREAAVRLEPFNLFIGPNGSGKTSLIEALLRLRTLAGRPSFAKASEGEPVNANGPQIEFHFTAPFQDARVTLGCNSDELVCNLLVVEHPPGIAGEAQWAELRPRLQGIRAYLFDHYAMAVPAIRSDGAELASNAGNLAAVLSARREQHPVAFKSLVEDFCRILPEFAGLGFRDTGDNRVELAARLAGTGETIAADSLSQGVLYLLATLTLAHSPSPPSMVCLEEADRGVHPRLLRELRDALYRLSYPQDAGLERTPAQVITTTHSPYLLDLFKEHPEEVVLASKHGQAATFMRLSERADLLDLLKEANLGDLWYSGILGGIPGE